MYFSNSELWLEIFINGPMLYNDLWPDIFRLDVPAWATAIFWTLAGYIYKMATAILWTLTRYF
jgi:hypothetical protein